MHHRGPPTPAQPPPSAPTTPASSPSPPRSSPVERLDFDDGLTLYGTADVLAVGWLANSRPRAPARRHHLLQRQSPHQPHQRLRSCVQALRLRPQKGRPRSATPWPSKRRMKPPPPATPKPSPSSTSSAACIPTCLSNISSTSSRGLKAALPQGPHQGLHHGRGRLSSRAAPSSPSSRP